MRFLLDFPYMSCHTSRVARTLRIRVVVEADTPPPLVSRSAICVAVVGRRILIVSSFGFSFVCPRVWRVVGGLFLVLVGLAGQGV